LRLRVDVVAKVSRNHDRIRATTGDAARVGSATINAKWFREYLDHDRRADVARLDVPVLAIPGSKDLQVNPADLAVIAATVPGPVQTWCAPRRHASAAQPAGRPSLRAYRSTQAATGHAETAALNRSGASASPVEGENITTPDSATA
jgi:hypothetical protein